MQNRNKDLIDAIVTTVVLGTHESLKFAKNLLDDRRLDNKALEQILKILIEKKLSKERLRGLIFSVITDIEKTNFVPIPVHSGGLPVAPDILHRFIDDLELTVRTTNCLKSQSILFVGELIQKTREGLLSSSNIDKKIISEIEDVLRLRGLSLGTDLGEDVAAELAERFRDL